jgi:hypothetical protein
MYWVFYCRRVTISLSAYKEHRQQHECHNINSYTTYFHPFIPSIYINNEPLPQAEDVKYLGLHLDRCLTWHKRIFTKRKHLGTILTKLYWLLGPKSKLDFNNKPLIYKVTVKPIWTYGIQLWGMASTSNIEIMERFQSKALHLITDAPWYVPNAVIRTDLQIPTIKEEIIGLSSKYSAGLNMHPNHLVTQLSNPPAFQRLRKLLPSDLPYKFTQSTYIITTVFKYYF